MTKNRIHNHFLRNMYQRHFLLLCSFFNAVLTQSVSWFSLIDGDDYDDLTHAAFDGDDIILVGNQWSSDLSYYLGNIQRNASLPWQAIQIIRIAANGTLLRSFYVTEYHGSVHDIAIDSQRNLLIAGHFATTSLSIFDIDGVSRRSLTSGGVSQAAFLIKFDLSGFCQWARRIQTTWSSLAGYDAIMDRVTVDGSGAVYALGYYTGSILEIRHQITGSLLKSWYPSAGLFDYFIVKYTSTGTYSYSARITGYDKDYGEPPFRPVLLVDKSGSMIVSGAFSDQVTVYDTQTGSRTVTQADDIIYAFLAGFNSDGTTSSLATFAGDDYIQFFTFLILRSDEILVVVQTSSDTSFVYRNPTGALTDLPLNSWIYGSIHVMKLSPSFASVTSVGRITGAGLLKNCHAAVDPYGNYSIGIEFAGAFLDLYDASAYYPLHIGTSDSINFVLIQFNASHSFQWYSTLGFDGLVDPWNYGVTDVILHSSGRSIISGYMNQGAGIRIYDGMRRFVARARGTVNNGGFYVLYDNDRLKPRTSVSYTTSTTRTTTSRMTSTSSKSVKSLSLSTVSVLTTENFAPSVPARLPDPTLNLNVIQESDNRVSKIIKSVEVASNVSLSSDYTFQLIISGLAGLGFLVLLLAVLLARQCLITQKKNSKGTQSVATKFPR